MNIANTVIPKSDQLNADDLLCGPRTIQISAITAGGKEQPVNVGYLGDGGRPWRPCMGMRRVLIALYGPESSGWVGQRVTLFNNPTVVYGGEKTGGIQVSHASGITSPLTIALTINRKKRVPFTVLPLKEMSEEEVKRLVAEAQVDGPEKAKLGTKLFMEWASALPGKVKRELSPESREAWKRIAEAVTPAE